MTRKVRLFVEGKADKKFFQDYITFLRDGDPLFLDIITIGGWTEIPRAEPKFKEHSDSGGINLYFSLPNLKSKIYAYLEALVPKADKELIREEKRDYKNKDHWDLTNPFLNPLRDFLLTGHYEYFEQD